MPGWRPGPRPYGKITDRPCFSWIPQHRRGDVNVISWFSYKSTRFFNFCNFIRFKIFQNRPPFFHLLLEIFNHGDLPYKVKKADEANNNFIKNKTKKDHSTKSFSYIISKKNIGIPSMLWNWPHLIKYMYRPKITIDPRSTKITKKKRKCS